MGLATFTLLPFHFHPFDLRSQDKMCKLEMSRRCLGSYFNLELFLKTKGKTEKWRLERCGFVGGGDKGR
jgi:hypothetical protein